MAHAHEASALMATTDYLNDRAATELDLAVVLHAAGQHDDAGRAARHAIQIWELRRTPSCPALARQAFGLE
jgi:hypothetical protein